jgi:hypothetical protein
MHWDGIISCDCCTSGCDGERKYSQPENLLSFVCIPSEYEPKLRHVLPFFDGSTANCVMQRAAGLKSRFWSSKFRRWPGRAHTPFDTDTDHSLLSQVKKLRAFPGPGRL